MYTNERSRWSGGAWRNGMRGIARRSAAFAGVLMIAMVFSACEEEDGPTGPLGPGGGEAEGTWAMVAGEDTTYVRVTGSSVVVLERAAGDECYTLTPYALLERDGEVFTLEDAEQTARVDWQFTRNGEQLVITDEEDSSITLTSSDVNVAAMTICPPPDVYTGDFPHDACEETTPAPLNGTIEGRLEGGDAEWPSDGSWYDVYALQIPTATTVSIAMNAAGGGYEVDTYLHLYNATAEERLYVDDDIDYDGGNYNSLIEAELEPGCYFIVANGYSDEEGEEGDYTLTIEAGGVVEPPEPDFPHAACSETPPLAIDGTVTGRLEPTDSLWSDGTYYDVWSLQLDATETVTIDYEARNPDVMDTYLLVYDETGVERIIDNDDADYDAGNYNSRGTAELGPGCYFVIAGSWSDEPDEADDYFLTVTTGAPVTPDFENVLGCTNLPELPLGGSVTDSLTTTDMTWSDGSFADLWSLKLGAETTVRITHTSDDQSVMDPYLFLYNNLGTVVVAENDDIDYDGGIYDAQVEATVGPGCYVVVANTWSDEAGEESGYTLAAEEL